ncbi:MAG: imelysin family protein [Flavobacteriaceae bacterium]
MKKKLFFNSILLFLIVSCVTDEELNPMEADLGSVQKTSLASNSSETTETVSETSDSENTQNFDRQAMLTFWSDQIIIPAYNRLYEDLALLKAAIVDFNQDPDQDKMEVVRAKWFEAYTTWQHVEMFNVGKAEEIYFSSHMNIYPVNVERVSANINSGVYDLENPNNYAAQGFPTLDYLLYGIGSNEAEIIEQFRNSEGKYSDYLLAVIDQMIFKTTQVVEDWVNFRDEFVQSVENTATSSINKLTNDFIFYFEKGLRANKFGIPAGVFSVNELPDRVEAYYSRSFSKALALESLQAVKNFFVGNAFETESETGTSFQAYLQFLNAEQQGVKLEDEILNNLDQAIEKVNELDADFVSQINTDNFAMLVTYDQIQEVVILFKVDMLQIFNINVDYADADGD